MAQPNNPNNPGNVMKPTPRAGAAAPRTLPTPSANAGTTLRTKTVTATGPVRPFLFDKSNYRIMLGGVLLILLGLFLMAGGKSADPHQFHYDEIFSFRRVTLAPLIMMIGFCLQIYAIMKRPAPIAVVMNDTTA